MLLQQLHMKLQDQIIGIDFDGTLVDSEKRHTTVLENILCNRNINIDIGDLMYLKSGGMSTVEILKAKGVQENVAKSIAMDWVENIEEIQYLKTDKLIYGADIFLKMASNNNKIVLITARKNINGLHQQLQDMHLKQYFYHICVVNPLNSKKEKTEILKQYKADCMIGDTEVDLYAALENKIDFYHIQSCFRSVEFMRHLCHDLRTFKSVCDLI